MTNRDRYNRRADLRSFHNNALIQGLITLGARARSGAHILAGILAPPPPPPLLSVNGPSCALSATIYRIIPYSKNLKSDGELTAKYLVEPSDDVPCLHNFPRLALINPGST